MKSMHREKERKKEENNLESLNYEEVIRRNSDTVYRLAYSLVRTRADADDIYQEVFLRYFRHEERFHNDEYRKAWLIRCTVNRCKSLLASPWRRRIVPLETAEEVGVEDDYREVYSAVLSLPAKYRAVIHLHYYEGCSTDEIAQMLGCRPGRSAPACPGPEAGCGS